MERLPLALHSFESQNLRALEFCPAHGNPRSYANYLNEDHAGFCKPFGLKNLRGFAIKVLGKHSHAWTVSRRVLTKFAAALRLRWAGETALVDGEEI